MSAASLSSMSSHDPPVAAPPSGLATEDFELFVLSYADRLHSVARRMLRCEEDAADAVQDALLSAFAARHRFQSDSTVYTWLYRIVVNACLMKLRSLGRSRMVSYDSMGAAAQDEECPSFCVASRIERVDERIERDETRAKVRAAIAQLPERYRTILLMRDIESRDTEETAALLKLSRSAVKTRLHRARQALRRLLAPTDERRRTASA